MRSKSNSDTFNPQGRLVSLLSHHELSEDVWRPRHPILCGINLFSLVLTVGLLVYYNPRPMVALLPVIVVFQYAVSCAYHWLPLRYTFWHKLDYQAIFLITGWTMVPYWITHIPQSDLTWRLLFAGLLTAGACAFRWFWFSWSKVGGVLSLSLACFTLGISFNGLKVWLPPLDWYLFWTGISCYFVSFVINKSERPRLWHGFFGYREFQHLPFVLTGTTLQVLVALRNL